MTRPTSRAPRIAAALLVAAGLATLGVGACGMGKIGGPDVGGAGGAGAASTGTTSGGGLASGSGAACGDGQCAGGESCKDCPGDCGACPSGCGDGVCAAGEDCASCPADCEDCALGCGDGQCTGEKDCENCPTDCGACAPTCGDGACAGGETCASCPSDCCPLPCGDGVCGAGEGCASCPDDCGECPACGDGSCDGAETCGTCPDDCCPPACGDQTCGAGEDCASCPEDCDECPGGCGDGACDVGETCTSCPADCGACPPSCGDGACNGGESCMSCPADCGACPATCGDGACNGQETCRECRADCGRCDESDVLAKCLFDPMQGWSGPGSRDITFAAFGDTHAYDATPGCAHKRGEAGDGPVPVRDAVNSIEQHVWPGGRGFANAGRKYDRLRGLVVVGDLVDSGSETVPSGQPRSCLEYSTFRDWYGRCGDEGKIHLPLYETFGNHDFPWQPPPGDVNNHPVLDYLDKIGPANRPGDPSDYFKDPVGGTAHWAWRWDDVWFVSLDVKPGSDVETIDKPKGRRMVDPHGSNAFLKRFLLSRQDSTKRQIVIVGHYPLGTGRIHDSEREALCKTLYQAQHATGDFTGKKLSAKWPVIAYLHGHTHKPPSHHDFHCPSPYGSITIPQFSVGTPLWGPKSHHPNAVELSIFRIGTTTLEVVGVHARKKKSKWKYVYKERLSYPEPP